ncbi:MAG: ABC transporter permease [Candidatus Bipolaricaulis sp.]|nr:ABC transporter permease [Candidatus Bipolaricaulis sp.]MDD5219663.1 ABC transporter permease [Candidatus Bipolaricaulis sp.]MDD5646966.1 ABC transporter permease [Candidatus Bipolaricaulis sp.]
MYWKYVARRLTYAMLTFLAVVFVFSAVFNSVADRVMRSQIQETVNGESRAFARQGVQRNQDQFLVWKAQRTAELQRLYHLDEPLFGRIFWRTIDTVTFRLGQSTIIRSSAGEQSVMKIVGERIPRTLLLFGVAILLDLIIGVVLGMWKARKAGGLMDKATSIGTMVVFGMPQWWLGMLLIMVFAFAIPLFPSGAMHSTPPPQGVGYGLDLLYHMLLPVLTLVVIGFWGISYTVRNIVLGTLQEDFVMSGRARGVPERKILFGHALRAAAPPIVTLSVLGLLGSLFGGILFEGIFSWPGMGSLYWQSVQQNDIPVLMGNLSLTTGIWIAGLAFLDLIYGFLDPRVKVAGKA